MKLKLKKLTIASVFAGFAAGWGVEWPLNVFVGWGERLSSYERGQHNNQKQMSNHVKTQQLALCVVLAVAMLALMMWVALLECWRVAGVWQDCGGNQQLAVTMAATAVATVVAF